MQPPIVSLPADEAADPEVVGNLVLALASGQIVALPTETCYGLAVRADQQVPLARLATLKGRPNERTFTWHLGSLDQLPDNLPLSGLVQRLAACYWPGPLTLVLPTSQTMAQTWGVGALWKDGRIGMRLPNHRGTQDVLRAAPFPVVMTSANASGEAPLSDARSVAAAFPTGLHSVADGGTSPGLSSTVLSLGPGGMEILRPGPLAWEDLRAQAGLRILFVCTGNTCRSPMAEALAREALARSLGVAPDRLSDYGFHVASGGVYAAQGSPASSTAVEALAEWDVNLQSHRSQPIESALTGGVDRVYGLTRSHIHALQAAFAGTPMPACELLDPRGQDIPDPFGGPLPIYQATRDAIQAAIQARMPEWVGPTEPQTH